MEKNKTLFKHPDVNKLRKEGLFLTDMHFHPNFLNSNYLNNNLIAKILNKKNICLAVTDHNSIQGAVRLHKSKNIIQGMEVISTEGIHSIYYFFKISDLKDFYLKYIRPNLNSKLYTYLDINFDDVIDYSKNYDCISCIPHPFTYFSYNVNDRIKNILKKKRVDCIESVNGFIPHNFNSKAVKLSEDVKAGITGGTDGRTLKEVGNVVTCAEADNAKEFLEALRKRKTNVIGSETGFADKVLNICHRPEMHPKNWIFSIKKRAGMIF